MSKPIKPENQKRLIALILALGLGYYLLLFLVSVYLIWDIYSTYRRMMSGMWVGSVNYIIPEVS